MNGLSTRLTCLAAITFVIAGTAQDVKVRDLTESAVTAEQLIEVLSPAPETAGEQLGVRGLGLATKPQCRVLDEGASRGITIKPVADIAALKILFAFNSAEILPETRRNLDALGRALGSQALSSFCFQIEGHTDSFGTEGYNQALSLRRAHAVVRYLVSELELDADRLLPVGHGESSPIADNRTEAGRSTNRRVQVVNIGSGSSSPRPLP